MNDQHEVTLSQGTIHYRDVGRGPVLLFVHGLLVSGSVWRKVVDRLSRRFRCIVPDWPLGSHRLPMNPDADLTPAGLARLIAEFTEALGLADVTLIGNDSGGALCQLVVAHHPERIGRLVLATCDAFEVFPPPLFWYLRPVTYVPGALALLTKSMMWIPALRRLPIAYGVVTKRPIPNEQLTEWVAPAAGNKGVRRDLEKFIRGVSPAITLRVAKELPAFKKPVLLAWAQEERNFPLRLAERLARTFPDARLVPIADALVFAQEDNPAALAEAIEAFAATESRVAASAS